MSAKRKKPMLPAELEGVATVEDVDTLIEKIEKCYSKERYEDFQGAVEKIIGRYLKFFLAGFALVWLLTLVASMLAQKFFSIF